MYAIISRIKILNVPYLQNSVAQHVTENVVSQSCTVKSSMQEMPLKSASIAMTGLVPVGVDSAGRVPCYVHRWSLTNTSEI